MSDERPAAPRSERHSRGFEAASRLLRERIRVAGEARGFAVSRLLTQWPEIVGEELARLSRPVRVGYGKSGFGATLTLLVEGAAAPIVDMSRERIREKVNACYGYNAISRVMLTQTAATGFAEGQAVFTPAPKARPAAPSPEVRAAAEATAEGCHDSDLRAALETLAQNVLMKTSGKAGQKKG
ncbi:DUF721 domain-containing protein [Paenirhodobacter enshiensis]|uniref:DUF721 domain-containing protein n=1 Tax=Paenirhodobacter enshiensis TaxID=1105367 RepID=A0A086Y3W9_9RHOB|nr:DUF721 domain-containing protein [Paenirhodobacter enshiensis]KFI28969.1 hypothetical protein CG50_12300 [Paenirhodobacter enshiensis]